MQSLSSAAPPTSDQWREDLAYLAERIELQHPNAFATMDRQAFEAAVAELNADIPDLEPHEIAVAMIRIAAMVGDGHTRMHLPRGGTGDDGPTEDLGFHRLPISFYQFSDGLFVRHASEEHRKLAGRKVVRIGNATAEEAMEAVAPLVHTTRVIRKGNISLEDARKPYESKYPQRNTSRVMDWGPLYVSIPEILHALGFVEDRNQINIELEDRAGKRESVKIAPVKLGTKIEWVDARDVPGIATAGKTPLYLRDSDKNYWFEYLEKERVMYVKYNSVQSMKGNSISRFCDKMFSFVDEHPVDKFILDIRHNGGGNNNLNRPIIHGIVVRTEKIDRRGKLFCIIGRQTFSAAMNCVNNLEQRTKVIFVGEPTAGAPNHFGDAKPIQLPGSGLTGGISTRYWQDARPREIRPWVPPKVSVQVSSTDYLSNHDPVVQAVLDWKR
jgi:hypothetical protein